MRAGENTDCGGPVASRIVRSHTVCVVHGTCGVVRTSAPAHPHAPAVRCALRGGLALQSSKEQSLIMPGSRGTVSQTDVSQNHAEAAMCWECVADKQTTTQVAVPRWRE